MERLLPYKQITAGSVPAPSTIFLIWWFAVISISGEIAYFEYVKKSSCDIIQSSYERTRSKVTKCIWKDQHEDGRSSL